MKLFQAKAPAAVPATAAVVGPLPGAPGSPERARVLAGLPKGRASGAPVGGHLERVLCAGGAGVALGWLAAPAGTVAWLRDDAGRVTELHDALFFTRQDITDAVAGKGFDGLAQAFLVPLTGVQPGQRYSLHALSPQTAHCFTSDVAASALPLDPLAAYRQLCEVYSPLGLQAERARRIEVPLLAPLIERRRGQWPATPTLVRRCGEAPAAPRVSLIVPMYGQFELLEPQLLKFSLDPWLAEHAELIYVVDDPALLEPMRLQADGLAQLYGRSFSWVWGGSNRGFAGANNLGVAAAQAEHLIFVNSDVFPTAPGWAQALLDTLERHPDVGAVGPRLLYADGSLQHAGMRFARRADLDTWVNQHPWRGLAPELDPARGPVTAPAVTGACLALRRADLAAVGGWDEGYLIGDFEDSDLCLALRARGQRIAYRPDISLTHLERQSLRDLGDGDFRTRVVLFNAARHQLRWQSAMAAPFVAEPLDGVPS